MLIKDKANLEYIVGAKLNLQVVFVRLS